MTAPAGKKADAFAQGLVSARLAACVNVIPGVVSHYRWKGRMTRGAECLLVAKTSAAKLPKLLAHVSTHHPYSVPEVLALNVAAGSKPYLKWLARELK
jgi:periplasmic divalent cation tolerance protein